MSWAWATPSSASISARRACWRVPFPSPDQCGHPRCAGQAVHMEGLHPAGGHRGQRGILPPFCKWLCPLGAFYALLNKVSLFQMRVDTHKCVSCGACAKACKMDVDITKTPNHAECIRCGMCMKACPTDAIQYKFGLGTNQIPKQQRSKTMKIHRIAALFSALCWLSALPPAGRAHLLHLLHLLHPLLPLPLRQQKAKPMSSCWPRKTRSFLQTMLCGRKCSHPWTKT